MRNPEKFEPKFEQNPPEEEKRIEVEVMKTPEIIIQPERGPILMSAIMKGFDPEWGNRDHELAKLTEQHFREYPLEPEIKNTIEELRKMGVDEESLYNLSLTYQHPERTGEVFSFLTKHKEIQDPEKEQQKLLKCLELLDSNPSFKKLEENFIKYREEDVEKRKNQLEESRKRIEELINFFRPKANTTNVERINLMPTDFLYHRKSGKSFMLGKELILMSPPEDYLDGQAHEFLHSVINPIVDKLDSKLSEDQKRKIVELASGKIKQHYGEDLENYYSHLCEGFIRTYVNIFEKGARSLTYEGFQELISQKIKSEKQFQEILAEDKELKQRCDSLSISNLMELKNKSGGYFEKYEEDRLGDVIYEFYGDYKQEYQDKLELTFEDFVLEKESQFFREEGV